MTFVIVTTKKSESQRNVSKIPRLIRNYSWQQQNVEKVVWNAGQHQGHCGNDVQWKRWGRKCATKGFLGAISMLVPAA